MLPWRPRPVTLICGQKVMLPGRLLARDAGRPSTGDLLGLGEQTSGPPRLVGDRGSDSFQIMQCSNPVPHAHPHQTGPDVPSGNEPLQIATAVAVGSPPISYLVGHGSISPEPKRVEEVAPEPWLLCPKVAETG